MEYHKPLVTALDKGPDSLVDRKRPCFNFIQGCLGNNDIVKTGSIFQHIHSMKHDVGVHNHIVHFTACELLGCAWKHKLGQQTCGIGFQVSMTNFTKRRITRNIVTKIVFANYLGSTSIAGPHKDFGRDRETRGKPFAFQHDDLSLQNVMRWIEQFYAGIFGSPWEPIYQMNAVVEVCNPHLFLDPSRRRTSIRRM